MGNTIKRSGYEQPNETVDENYHLIEEKKDEKQEIVYKENKENKENTQINQSYTKYGKYE